MDSFVQMFRQFTVIFLLFALFAQVFSRSAIIMDYYTHVTAYSKKCENKARPQMHCKGKCQMMKKLKEREKKDQELPSGKAELKNEMISSRSFFTHIPVQKSQTGTPDFACFLITFPEGTHTGVFHPPILN
jgi:hypothetical protein